MAATIQSFAEELKTLLEGKIDDCNRIMFVPGLETAKMASLGKNGRYIAIIDQGGPVGPLMGAATYTRDFAIYVLISGVWQTGSALEERYPVLMDDMETIRDTVDGYNFTGVCYAIVTRELGTGDYSLLQDRGMAHGCHAGFILQVQILGT